jgi:hypothetical protein
MLTMAFSLPSLRQSMEMTQSQHLGRVSSHLWHLKSCVVIGAMDCFTRGFEIKASGLGNVYV